MLSVIYGECNITHLTTLIILCIIILSVIPSSKHTRRYYFLPWTKAVAFYSENNVSEPEELIFGISGAS
jgi:hypothetical protein